LALIHETDEGVPQDHTAAAAWYRRAAEQGDAAPSTVWPEWRRRARACRGTTRRPGIGFP
jgi:hypothetical protein